MRNEELNDLYSLPITVRVIKSRRMRWAGHMARMGEERGCTGFSWFPCVYKQILRWFSKFQVATTCFSCSPADLNLVVTNFMFCLHVK